MIGAYRAFKNNSRSGENILKNFQEKNLIKSWFITNNKTGCRFLIVDSRPEATTFYQKCGFEIYPEQRLNGKTHLLFFDLKAFESELQQR
jgi:hypothetical protein